VTDQEALIESAAIGLRRAGREVSVRNVAAVVKALRGGRGYEWRVIGDILKANNRFEARRVSATPPQPARNTKRNGLTKDAQQQPQRSRNARAGDSKVLPRIPNAEATETTSPPLRRARVGKPVPEIPDALRIDVERLVANDAARRQDGKIADSVVEGDLLVLRRAYERHLRVDVATGLAALRRGVDVALDKGKGLRFAAGCVRHYDPVREGVPQPALFGDRVVPIERGIRVPPGLSTAAEAVFRQHARPGEDLPTLSRRLLREDEAAFARLNGLPPPLADLEMAAR
jgi:hypothetical protein